MEQGSERQDRENSGIGSGLWIAAFVALAFFLLPSENARAEDGGYTVTETVETIEYEIVEPVQRGLSRTEALADYGPFRVVNSDTVEMAGTVDSYSPRQFRTMLTRYPGIKKIVMLDCDGSIDEEANLRLARQIRRAGIDTHVPAHGSIRSGAVELFLAGVRHTADPGAEFVVHSWMDEDGLEAKDYPADDPVHREYLDYYAEMGVPADKAQAFYALTNSVPYSGQLKLSRQDLARYQMLH